MKLDGEGKSAVTAERTPAVIEDKWGKFKWTANPLVLLLAGALATFALGPYLTQKWQDRQAKLDNQRAQLELKVTLLHRLTTLTISEMAFLDDPFSSATGLTKNVGYSDRAKTRRRWILAATDLDGELSAWFPDEVKPTPASIASHMRIVSPTLLRAGSARQAAGRPAPRTSRMADRWATLQGEILAFEGEQASFKAVPRSPLGKSPYTCTQTDSPAKTPAQKAACENAGIQRKQVAILTHLGRERRGDRFQRKTIGLLAALAKIHADNMSIKLAGEKASQNKPALQVRIEADIHTATIFEFVNARARFASHLLATPARGYRAD